MVALAACGDDASGTGDGGMRDAAAPPNTGSVFLSSYKSMQVGTQVMGNIINASFLPAQPQAFTCTSQVIGPCVLSQCTQSTALPMYVSGGTITLTGLSRAVTMTPSTITNMYQPDNTTNSFVGGETVTIAGTGATAPAFMMSLTAPSLASITAPTKPAGMDPLLINRSQDLAVAWSGGGTGDMDFVFGSTNGTNPGPTLNCSFPASAGSGTIPTAALAMLPAGNGSFSGSTEALESVDVGEWRFWGQAYFTAVWSVDMTQLGVTTTLQ
jgi:hypothetical protein